MYHRLKQYNIIDRNIILIRLKFGCYHWLLGESCIYNEIVQIESSKAFRISSVFCRNFSIVSICASKNPRGAAVSLKVFRWHQCHVRLVKNLMKSTCLIYERFYGQITHFVHTRDFWSTRIYVSPVLFQNYKDSLNANEISTQARSGEIKIRGNPGI